MYVSLLKNDVLDDGCAILPCMQCTEFAHRFAVQRQYTYCIYAWLFALGVSTACLLCCAYRMLSPLDASTARLLRCAYRMLPPSIAIAVHTRWYVLLVNFEVHTTSQTTAVRFRST